MILRPCAAARHTAVVVVDMALGLGMKDLLGEGGAVCMGLQVEVLVVAQMTLVEDVVVCKGLALVLVAVGCNHQVLALVPAEL